MTERLVQRVADEARGAARWSPGDDPLPVLEALGHCVVLHLVGALPELSEEEARALLAVAEGALDAARAGHYDDPEDALAYREGADLAELGARLLGGERVDAFDRYPSELRTPTDRRVIRMLRGELDGLSAAACAVHCLRHGDPRPRLLWELERSAIGDAAPPVLLAAADAAPIRSPEGGRTVASDEAAGLELVYFPADRALAVYAASPAFVQVAGKGLSPRDVQPGYFLGEVAEGAGPALALEVRVGERVVRFDVRLEPG